MTQVELLPSRPRRRFRLPQALIAILAAAGACMPAMASQPPTTEHSTSARAGSSAEALSRWQYVYALPLPADMQSPERTAAWYDFVVPTSVFDAARLDLGDLRLYDAAGNEVPYALRIRRSEHTREPVAAQEFNRAKGPGDSTELTLDLGTHTIQYNQVEVATPGTEFRRRAQLEGSEDGRAWRTLVEKDLIRFQAEGKTVERLKLAFPPSRFRYLKIRVYPDPVADRKPVEINSVTVLRTVELPGEFATLPTQLGAREAVRADRGPGSAWVISLGGNNVPCQRIAVRIADAEFARDYAILPGGPPGSDQPFSYRIVTGTWRRQAGESRAPMVAEFNEVPAARLRLVITDHRNPSLGVESVEFAAAVRQVVLARSQAIHGPLKLYVGNPKAEPPHYDLERNLPARLDPPPLRLTLLDKREDNPVYQPEPKPLTERWPWLIYVVLGSVSLVLGVIIISLARAAVALHDAQQPAAGAGEAG